MSKSNSSLGFVEDKPYAVTNEQGKQFVTSQYVRATHGKSERKWPFITCSDSKITEVRVSIGVSSMTLMVLPSPSGIATNKLA